MSDNNVGQQFKIYRGIHLGQADPSDDATVDRVRPRRGVPEQFQGRAVEYGTHWTTEPETARTFALHASTNLDHRGPGARSQRPRTGVVIEARVSQQPEPSKTQAGFGEHEVAWPGQLDVEDMTMHVHHLPADQPIHRTETLVRSVSPKAG